MPAFDPPDPVADYQVTPDDLAKSFRRDVYDGLTATPKSLPPKWGYDERGSELFEEITRLEEYYLTRAERGILAARAAEIAAVTGADTLIELGAGSGEKTRLLLDALGLRRYVPVDVSGDFLAEAARHLRADYPGLDVHPIVADFEQGLQALPAGGRRLIAFLGSTAGNLTASGRVSFYTELRSLTTPGADALLLGFDLVKDVPRIEAAYNDRYGVSAEFNRNLLHVINRELGADFDPARFAHVSTWDPEAECVLRALRSTGPQRVRVRDLDLTVDLAEGEEIRTEISDKFRQEGVRAELAEAGFTLTHWWPDPPSDYALSLATPTP
ncbi:L-histidine N(alpha)-methyltransferase [Bailinhaonella thermotolerans]|uniref:L-histidine N(Alpha)-methyltransferase n=1 Tax=Bailinhaonella thermotolerans TaxID=1070861 RepID=A0A3A4AKB8_9ACTN|nr:L-histidine N(alpha)-methyltransferase [Bailinhaonella thermotolerans]RJL30096.1 L-histidine N(alpha)-methyltransferase [Bailinhaonella thermotolerans]